MTHHCNCGSLHDESEIGPNYSLYEKIELENVECLNECDEGSGVTVFKKWEDRLNKDKYVESDTDEELLFNIPFTGNIKLKGLIVIGGEDDFHPSKVRLYKNRPNMTFDNAATEADQEFDLVVDTQGVHEYTPKVVKFSSISHLSLHFVGNGRSEQSKIYYIGLKGEWSPGHKHGVTICTYEVLPQMSDHPKDDRDVDRSIR